MPFTDVTLIMTSLGKKNKNNRLKRHDQPLEKGIWQVVRQRNGDEDATQWAKQVVGGRRL